LPLVLGLSKRRIGQLWINHTGLDKSRDYGTNTRTWQLDTAMVATKLDRPEVDIAFRLDFPKCRQRTPANRADYEPINFILQNDAWSTEPAETKSPKVQSEPKNYRNALGLLHNLLVDAEPVTPCRDHVTVRAIRLDAWRDECARCGLLDRDKTGSIDAASRKRFGRIKEHAIACHAAQIRDPWIWKP